MAIMIRPYMNNTFSTIGLRPLRSAIAPQYGLDSAAQNEAAPIRIPDHIATSLGSLMPKTVTYSGKKEIMPVMALIPMNCVAHMIAKFFFHSTIIHV